MVKKFEKPDFSTRLKNLREALGLTQAELAEKIGIPRTSLANYEKGTSVPPGDFICVLKLMFDVDSDWFLTGQGEMFATKEQKKHPLIMDLEAMIDKRLEKFEAQIAEIEAQVRKKTVNGPDSVMFTFDPEPEYAEETENVALVEGIAAGKPVFQSESRSTVPVPKRYIKTRPEDYFAGRIMGTSMTNAGIPDGCMALFRISDVPRNGAIQIVEWAGEATLKRIWEDPENGWRICFEDGSKRFIPVGPGEEPRIQGDFVMILDE